MEEQSNQWRQSIPCTTAFAVETRNAHALVRAERVSVCKEVTAAMFYLLGWIGDTYFNVRIKLMEIYKENYRGYKAVYKYL